MIKLIKSLIKCSIWILFLNLIVLSQVDRAYQHLYDVMDKYHKTFDVYSDQDAGGNNFHPTIIGNYKALKITNSCTTDVAFGNQCIKITYNDTFPLTDDWAGVYWLSPDKNWGEKQGHDIPGAEKLVFWAKGEKGGEKVEFKLGGVNRPAESDPNKHYHDSCDLLSTGTITLTNKWQEYNINLLSTDYFAIYLDGDAGSNNRYFPTGWYNNDANSTNMAFNPNCTQNPHSGSSCIRVEWNGLWGPKGPWNGVMWQYPARNWGEKLGLGNNLSGATKLTFWAKSDIPDLRIEFIVGYPNDSCGEIKIVKQLTTSWRQYEINLKGMDLSNVAGGFAFIFNNDLYPYSLNYVFYLDDIQFDKPLEKNLNNIIGGFCCAVNKSDNQNECNFYLDKIQYQLNSEAEIARLKQPRFLVSYETTTDSLDIFLRNTAFIYDNALAMLALMARGTNEDWKRASILVRAFNYCQNHDREYKGNLKDNRLRNGYHAGDVINNVNKWAVLPGIWDEKNGRQLEDEFCLNSHTGNLAWVMIALCRYYLDGIHKSYVDPAILDSAKTTSIRMGHWIYDKCFDTKFGPPGFVGGFEGRGHVLVTWKSLEHNLDAFIAFSLLAEMDSLNKELWLQNASYAKIFIEAMWNPIGHYFYAGTKANGEINDTFFEDVQTWSFLASRYTKNIKLAEFPYWEAVEKAKESCYVKCCGREGFDFNTDRDGIWYEGTAHMALAFCKLGDSIKSEFYLQELRYAQNSANHNNDKGIVAACHDVITTGLDWKYLNRLHIGATAWYILAELGFNPYTVVEQPPRHQISIPYNYLLFQNYPNPFNSETVISYFLPQSSDVELKIYNLHGQQIRTLVDKRQRADNYSIYWDGKDEHEQSVASGIYWIQLITESRTMIKPMVLIR